MRKLALPFLAAIALTLGLSFAAVAVNPDEIDLSDYPPKECKDVFDDVCPVGWCANTAAAQDCKLQCYDPTDGAWVWRDCRKAQDAEEVETR